SCESCHGAGRAEEPFLAPNPDVRTTLLGWPEMVRLDSPSASRLLTKGAHTGPAWTSEEAESIKRWIEAEAVAAAGGGGDGDAGMPVYETSPISITPGANQIPLDSLGLTGSSISFIASPVGSGIYVSSLRVMAGP